MAVSSGPKITKDGLVLYLDAANFESFRGEPTTNLLSSFSPNVTQQVIKGEFGQYYNLVSIFETYGLVPYSLSFDMKATKPGNVLWYMQNSSYTKYGFVYHWRYATTEWQRFKIENITPDGPRANWQANTPNDNRAMLATYTIYGSGIRPIVKNIQIELGSKATAFVSGSRGTTVATGGGWADMTNNGNHGELINGTSYDSGSLGALSFDGVNDYVNLGSRTLTGPATFSIWLKTDQTSGDQVWFGLGSYDWSNSIGIMNWGNNLTLFGSSGYSILDSHLLIRNGNWVNVVVTQTDSTNATITSYINGVFGTQQTNKTGISYSSTANYIGMRFDNNVHFNGKISQVSIYNRALSETEIRKNYEATRARYGL
jgi:hypothetical protein